MFIRRLHLTLTANPWETVCSSTSFLELNLGEMLTAFSGYNPYVIKKILQFIQICINSKNAFHKRIMSKWRLVTFLGNQLKYYASSFWEYRVTKMKQSEQKIVCIWNSCVTTAAIRMKSGTGSCFANYIWMLKPSRKRFSVLLGSLESQGLITDIRTSLIRWC